jgi:DNA-directed RNA polymerase specialized sigma subunit
VKGRPPGVRRAGPKKRALTISHLIANVREQTGREPSTEEIAGYLACSPRKVRIHLQSLKGTRQ